MKPTVNYTILLLLSIIFIFSNNNAFSQNIKISGKVITEDGLPIKNVKILVAESAYNLSDSEGNFNFYSNKKLTMPFKVTIIKEGFQMKTFSLSESGTDIEIIIEKNSKGLGKEISIKFYDDKKNTLNNVKVTIDGYRYLTDNKGFILTKRPFLEKSIVLVEGYEVAEINFNEIKKIVEVSSIKNTNAPSVKAITSIKNQDKNDKLLDTISQESLKQKITYEAYKGGIEEVTMQIKAEQIRVEGNNKKIRDEIITITDRLKNEKNLSDEQRNELKGQVNRMESIVLENTIAFQKSQERTNFLILNLKNIISEKDSNYNNALKKIAFVEKENRITVRKFNRNLIIFSIISIALLILAMVFYAIAVKMRKQRKELIKSNKEMLGVKELLELKLLEMNVQRQLIEEQQQRLSGKG